MFGSFKQKNQAIISFEGAAEGRWMVLLRETFDPVELR